MDYLVVDGVIYPTKCHKTSNRTPARRICFTSSPLSNLVLISFRPTCYRSMAVYLYHALVDYSYALEANIDVHNVLCFLNQTQQPFPSHHPSFSLSIAPNSQCIVPINGRSTRSCGQPHRSFPNQRADHISCFDYIQTVNKAKAQKNHLCRQRTQIYP
jgi:hypothetical protein